jgi:hypothetical protein
VLGSRRLIEPALAVAAAERMGSSDAHLKVSWVL